jgi:hypothetical protein
MPNSLDMMDYTEEGVFFTEEEIREAHKCFAEDIKSEISEHAEEVFEKWMEKEA